MFAQVDPTSAVVAGRSIIVDLIVASSPLILGILGILFKQISASKALKRSEEKTLLAFGVVDTQMSGLRESVSNLGDEIGQLKSNVATLKTTVEDVPIGLTDVELSQRMENFCAGKMPAVSVQIVELGQQVAAIAEKLKVVSHTNDLERTAFRRHFFLKLARIGDLFPTNRGLVLDLNKFFVDYIDLVESIVADLDNFATPEFIKSAFDANFLTWEHYLREGYQAEFVSMAKKELARPYRKAVSDLSDVVFDIANSKKSRLYAIALSFAELGLTLWTKVYQEFLMKYSEEPGRKDGNSR